VTPLQFFVHPGGHGHGDYELFMTTRWRRLERKDLIQVSAVSFISYDSIFIIKSTMRN